MNHSTLKLVLSILLSFALSCCNISESKSSNANKLPSMQGKIIGPLAMNQVNIINNWLKTTIGNEYPIETYLVNQANFQSIDLYKNKPFLPIKNKLFFLLKGLKPEIVVADKLIKLEYRSKDFDHQRFMLFQDKVVLSHYSTNVRDMDSYIFDLETGKLTETHYVVLNIKKDEADICSESYDGKNYRWKYGKLNIYNKSIAWGKHDSSSITMEKEEGPVLNNWLKLTIGNEYPMDVNMIKKIKFKSLDAYKYQPYLPLQDKLVFNVKGIKPQITFTDELVKLEYTDEFYSFQRLLLLEDKVVLSYHPGTGDDSHSYIFNLLTDEVVENNYTILNIRNNEAEICSEGYDDDGHYWHYGKQNLETDSIVWGEIEH